MQSNCEDKWAEAKMMEQKEELNDKLQPLINLLRFQHFDENLSIISEIEKLMSQIYHEKYEILDRKVVDLYDRIIDAAMELELQTVILKTLKVECNIEPMLESKHKHILYNDSSQDMIYLCISILATMASGSKECFECIDALSLHSLAEMLCLQHKNDQLSVLAFKLLSCLISGDAEWGNTSYAGEICGRIEYHIRAKELLQNDHLCDSNKVWIICFWEWTMDTYEIKSTLPNWVIHTAVCSAFAFLEKNDVICQYQAACTLQTIFNEDIFILRENILRDVVKHYIPILVARLTDPCSDFVCNIIKALSIIFRSDPCFRSERKFPERLVFVGVTNGLLHHVVELFQRDPNEDLISCLLSLIAALSQYDSSCFVNPELAHDIIARIYFYMHSTNLKLATQSLVVLHNFLYAIGRPVYPSTHLRNYIIERPDFISAMFELMKRVTSYIGKGTTTQDDEWNLYLATVIEFGLRIMLLLLNYGEKEQDMNRGTILTFFKSNDVIKMLTDVKELKLNMSFPAYNWDFDWQLCLLLRELKALFHLNRIFCFDDHALFEDE